MNTPADTLLTCRDCGATEPRARCSTTGPLKSFDDDGNLVRQWAHVCRHCFGTNLKPTGETK